MEALSSFTNNHLKINIEEPSFISSVCHAFLNFALWMIIPHLEFKYNIISKFTKGNKGIANDFFSFFLIHTGALRNLYFNEAMKSGITVNYGSVLFNYLVEAIGMVLIGIGAIIIILTFYRMGIRGMYFGDHFGFFFSEKITAFPFSHMSNPQYNGTTIFFLGCALFYHSPSGIFLTLLTYVLYMILNVFESQKLEIFYPSTKKNKDN